MSEQKQKIKGLEKDIKQLKKDNAELEKVMVWLLKEPSSIKCYLKAYKFLRATPDSQLSVEFPEEIHIIQHYWNKKQWWERHPNGITFKPRDISITDFPDRDRLMAEINPKWFYKEGGKDLL